MLSMPLHIQVTWMVAVTKPDLFYAMLEASEQSKVEAEKKSLLEKSARAFSWA